MAADFSFLPRLEAGVMQYSFDSGAISYSLATDPGEPDTGFNFTQQEFGYTDTLLVLGGGGTLFMNKFFLDFSWQSATGGEDRARGSFSGYSGECSNCTTAYLAAEPLYEASFDRTDITASIGYAFSRRFSVFAGYKRTKTEFDATYQGRYSMVVHDDSGTIPIDSAGGRLWGDADYNFECKGPFVGAIQGWDFSEDYYLRGVLTASLALAYLEGEVEVQRRTMHMSMTWLNGVEVPESPVVAIPVGLANRWNTQGETLGYTLGIGWRGTTSVPGLTYVLNVSGYRYEFDADDPAQSDINETAVVLKGGLSYAF